VRNDVPAAIPLLALILGLAVGPVLINPWFAIVGLLLISPRLGRTTLFIAAGIFLSTHRAPNPKFPNDEFTIIQAPIEHDWQTRDNHSFVLRASRFRANGTEIEKPLAIYARFTPPEIAMEKLVRVEAILRRNEQGDFIASVKAPQLLSYEGALPRWHPAAWNRILANRLEAHADKHPVEVALAQALVLGRGERLDDALRDSYRRGGTYHLLVFSGLQIAFAAAILAALLRWLHRPRASDWLLLAFSILAPLFIGPTASVSRASIGIGLYALSRILRRPTSLENLWCVAALARLILEPGDLSDAAFHLTYAGAGALLFIGKWFPPRRWLASIIAAEITMTPIVLFHFHQFALGGALLTVLMSPIIFAMLVVCALACAMPCDALFAIIGALHRTCAFLNQFGVSGFFTAPPLASWILAAGLAFLALAFLRERRRAIVIAAAMLIPSVAAIVSFVRERGVDHPRVTFYDVGQGDAITIRSGTHTMLIDGGPGKRILPLLVDRGVRRIDTLVVTHTDADHCEGAVAAIESLDVGEVRISPREFKGDCAQRLLEVKRAPIRFVRDGDVLSLDGIRLTAHIAERSFRHARSNNACIVLHTQIGGRSMLFTADIEREAEIHFDDRDLRADVLKVAHHGSRSSTSRMFLDAVAPRLAFISCGRNNLFGHPHPSVLRALEEHGVRTWRTDRDGTIDLDVRDAKLYVTPGQD